MARRSFTLWSLLALTVLVLSISTSSVVQAHDDDFDDEDDLHGADSPSSKAEKYTFTGGPTNNPRFAVIIPPTPAPIKAPSINAWKKLPSMPASLGEVASAVIGDNLYVFGGAISTSNAAQKETFRYNFISKTWTSGLAKRPYPGTHQLALVYNGLIWVFGGLQSAGALSGGKLQIYDPKSDSWKVGPSLSWAGGSLNGAVIGNKMYIAGGTISRAKGTVPTTVEFDPATGKYTKKADMILGRNHAASGTDGRFLYVFGGRTGCNCVAPGFPDVQRYDPVANKWTLLSVKLPQKRGGMGVAAFANGKFYIIGGETNDKKSGAKKGGVYDRVDIYDTTTGKFSLGAPMPTARHGIYPVFYKGGIYVAGGGVKSGNSASSVFEEYLP